MRWICGSDNQHYCWIKIFVVFNIIFWRDKTNEMFYYHSRPSSIQKYFFYFTHHRLTLRRGVFVIFCQYRTVSSHRLVCLFCHNNMKIIFPPITNIGPVSLTASETSPSESARAQTLLCKRVIILCGIDKSRESRWRRKIHTGRIARRERRIAAALL